MKKWAFQIVIIGICLLLLPLIAEATTIVDSGDCGNSVTWTLDDEGLLTISGTGDMTSHPWNNDALKKVIINDGMVYPGSRSSKMDVDGMRIKKLLQSVCSSAARALTFFRFDPVDALAI